MFFSTTTLLAAGAVQSGTFLTGGIDWATRGYSLYWAKSPTASQLGMSGTTLVDALNAAGWAIDDADFEDRISVVQRDGRYCLRFRMPGGDGSTGDEKHGGGLEIRPNGLDGVARNAVIRYEMFMPASGGHVDIGAGGKLPGLIGARPGVSSSPAGGINYTDAMSMRGGWTGSQRWAPYAYTYPNSDYGSSFPCNDSINGDSAAGWNNQGSTNNTSEHLADHYGVWLRIEMEVIWNSGTNTDGEVNVWMNSVQKLNKTGLRFVEETDGLIHGPWITEYTNYGGSAPAIVQPQIWDFYGFEFWVKP